MASPDSLFYLVRIPPASIADALGQIEIPERIKSTLVLPHNLHQSCSSLQPPDMREPMTRALASISTPGFALELNQLICSRSQRGSRTGWRLLLVGPEPKSEPFRRLTSELRTASARCEVKDRHDNTAHVSVSYFSPLPLTAQLPRPVFVTVDHVELVAVAGSGRHYRYETIYRKELGPVVPTLSQASLF